MDRRLALSLVLLCGACSDGGLSPAGASCNGSAECQGGLVCVAFRCTSDLSQIEGGTVPMLEDAGEPPDGGEAIDAGDGMVDAGDGMADAGPMVEMDAGPGGVDAGPGMMDAGPPMVDAGFDAGPPMVDAGFDAGPPMVDAGFDAGAPPPPDAGP